MDGATKEVLPGQMEKQRPNERQSRHDVEVVGLGWTKQSIQLQANNNVANYADHGSPFDQVHNVYEA